ncbi:MAG: hypothetical protein CFE35_20620 [Novosphingobium sp. PASSN1]|nr:MAG: hypothetical protein CFE35_20620 [Novosphingobium sp. PASSN1]
MAQNEPAKIETVAIPAPDAERLALARDLIAQAFPEEKREALFTDAMDAMMKPLRKALDSETECDPELAAITNRKFDSWFETSKVVAKKHIPAQMDAMAQAYAREFSAKELSEYSAFAATPGGKHFFLRNTAILSDPSVAAASENYMRELVPIMSKMSEELNAEIAAYKGKHPAKGKAKH